MFGAKCPYCGSDQEICHDDGYGYAEDETFEHECSKCEKNFAFTTTILFSYTTYKADCLNGAEHNFKPVKYYPNLYPDAVRCVDCDYEIRGDFDESVL